MRLYRYWAGSTGNGDALASTVGDTGRGVESPLRTGYRRGLQAYAPYKPSVNVLRMRRSQSGSICRWYLRAVRTLPVVLSPASKPDNLIWSATLTENAVVILVEHGKGGKDRYVRNFFGFCGFIGGWQSRRTGCSRS